MAGLGLPAAGDGGDEGAGVSTFEWVLLSLVVVWTLAILFIYFRCTD